MIAIILCMYISMVSSFKFVLKQESMINLNNLIENKINKPMILKSNVNFLEKNYLFYLSKTNNFQFKEYTFDQFILEKPYLKYNKNIIYINDFFPKEGRVFNSYEKCILNNLDKYNNNLIILDTKNINNSIIKCDEIVKKFDVYQFPNLSKSDIINYIYDIIDIEKYSYDLYLLNWYNYDNIDKINLEKINILLFEVNTMFKNNLSFKTINSHMNEIIDLLIDI